MTVAAHLAAARAAHDEYRRHAGHIGKDGKPVSLGDVERATAAIRSALEHRVDADTDDPGHADPAWRLDKVPSVELVQFYTAYLNG
jgi:hypothetical protein